MMFIYQIIVPFRVKLRIKQGTIEVMVTMAYPQGLRSDQDIYPAMVKKNQRW